MKKTDDMTIWLSVMYHSLGSKYLIGSQYGMHVEIADVLERRDEERFEKVERCWTEVYM